MKNIKSLFTIVVTFIFILVVFVDTNAAMPKPKAIDMALATNSLREIKNGDKYISQIDKIIEKYEKNKSVLQKLALRIERAKSRIVSYKKLSTTKKQKLLIVVNYLDLKTKEALYNLYIEELE